MLPQEHMIQAVRTLCKEDKRIVAAAMYGSFAQGEGDQFSDIEFYLFVDDAVCDAFDLAEWIARIAPVDECFQSEFGATVALFSNLIRGEFHACPASSMSRVRDWSRNVRVRDVAAMVIVDRTGKLTKHLSSLVGSGADRVNQQEVSLLLRRYLDWMIFGTNVLRRGEHARALELLWFVQRHLLWMARIVEGATEHYPTPSKELETDISANAYERYRRCTAILDFQSLTGAYTESWLWGKELMEGLVRSYDIIAPKTIAEKLNRRFVEWFQKQVPPDKSAGGDA